MSLVYTPHCFDEKTEHVSQRLLGGDKSARLLGFGVKSIGFFGGMSLLVNNMTGPAMVAIPVLFQQAGWVPTVIMMFVLMVISNLSSTFLCEAMTSIPGNDHFQSRIELSTVANAYFSPFFYRVTMLLLIISLQAANIAAIIVSAQTMDLTLLAIFKWTGGLEFYPRPGFVSVVEAGTEISPFPDIYLLSLGFLVVLIIAIPLGFFNLDDNVVVQEGAFVLMLIIVAEWVVSICIDGIQFDRVPAFGPSQATLVGALIFNYAFVVSVPSWVNEMKKGVSINKSIWISNGVATFLFLVIGFFAGWGFDYNGTQDLLNVIDSNSVGPLRIVSKITVYLFPAVVLLSGIPVMSIIIRYNLVRSGLCGKAWGNFWGVVFPWIVSIPFYTGEGFLQIVNWAALLVNGFVNFIIPLLLYIYSKRSQYQIFNKDGAEESPLLVNSVYRSSITDYIAPSFKALPFFKPTQDNDSILVKLAVGLIVFVVLLSLAGIAIDIAEIFTSF